MKHKSFFLIKLFFVLMTFNQLLIQINTANYDSCIQAVQNSDTDEEILEAMKTHMEPFSSNHEECIDVLLKTGNFDSGKYLMDHLLLNKVKFRDSLKKTVNNIEINMKELYNKYRFEEEEFQTVSPVIQWAQSMNQVFLHIKFSHRHDSPGCPEVKNLLVDLFPSKIFLQGYCIQADIPIKFQLDLPLFVEIAPEESKHNPEANGRYIFNLTKAQQGMYWDRLVRDPSDYPKHTKIWLEMQERYKSEIESYIEDDEEEEFKKLMEDLNKKKKKGRKKKVSFDK